MKKLALSLVAVLGLYLSPLSTVSTASACDGETGHTAAAPAAKAGVQKTGVQKVSLEGKVVTAGCPMEAAKANCTGVALVVGETKHPIKKAAKGSELAGKAKDTDKLVKVTGTQEGELLTVTGYEIKG
jgi:hypothetical protein